MRWLDTIRLRLRSLFGRTRANEELDTESGVGAVAASLAVCGC